MYPKIVYQIIVINEKNLECTTQMGGRVPRKIKEQVIKLWLQGLSRQEIAKRIDIGVGSVTAIIKEASHQEREYHDIDLLREVSVMLRRDGLDLGHVAFAIRLRRRMEENGMNEDQLESVIVDFSSYCFKHGLGLDKLIKSTYQAFDLADRSDIRVDKIPEYIESGKETVKQLELQRQDLISKKQTILDEINVLLEQREEYQNKVTPIERIKKLEKELKEKNDLCESLQNELEAARTKISDLLMELAEYQQKLNECEEELDSLRKQQGNYEDI